MIKNLYVIITNKIKLQNKQCNQHKQILYMKKL